MGHDVHFLERLERVDVGQAERALALYRNPELVKALLAELTLPAGADRVAIALDATEPSPHVIVSRDGHFVTCLAAEMTLGSAFRVRRATVDGVRARHERLRKAIDTAGTGQLKQLFRGLAVNPAGFMREDAQVLAAVHPLVGPQLVAFTGEFFTTQLKLLNWLSARNDPPAVRREGLEIIWKLQWAMSVVTAAVTAQGAPAVMLSEDLRGKSVRTWVGYLKHSLLLRPTGARGLWAAAHLARHDLPELKQIRAEAVSGNSIAVANLTLGLVALRHPKYRAEISKVLQTTPGQQEPDGERRGAIARVDRLTAEPILEMLTDPEKAQAASDTFLREWCATRLVEPTDNPGTFYLLEHGRVKHPLLVWPFECLKVLPWLAKARFEDLFAPGAACRETPVASEDLEYLFEVSAQVCIGRTDPVRAPQQVGRNEPCACGSGKKSKKCCAA